METTNNGKENKVNGLYNLFIHPWLWRLEFKKKKSLNEEGINFIYFYNWNYNIQQQKLILFIFQINNTEKYLS